MIVEGQKFEMGRTVLTPGADALLAWNKVIEFLVRHGRGDWGDIDDEDRAENEHALKQGNLRLLSVYNTERGETIWIITEADRSVTTILLPGEY